MKIFVCYHKKVPVCVSNVLVPIYVGKDISKECLEFPGDNIGDNISKKNPYFCELTANYWIWKNVKSDIVGMCHYRRYFNFKNNHTKVNKISTNFAKWSGNNSETITPLLEKYDIILPQKVRDKKFPKTLYDFYKKVHVISDLEVTLNVIKEKYPQQYEMACRFLHEETAGYYGNMFVARKDLFDKYASWLFDILFEVEKRIQPDVIKRDLYQQRVYGFLAERLMNIYIALHPELKIKELPVLFVEEDKKLWRKYIFRYWKRKFLNSLGIGRKKNG